MPQLKAQNKIHREKALKKLPAFQSPPSEPKKKEKDERSIDNLFIHQKIHSWIKTTSIMYV